LRTRGKWPPHEGASEQTREMPSIHRQSLSAIL
jgi:hypothetical protein